MADMADTRTPPALAPRDLRIAGWMIASALVGLAWATYSLVSTGGERGEAQLQPLVWTIFATPFALFIGWTIARRHEVWLAAFACFCLYFFTPFVAARIESLVVTPEQARAMGHSVYFQAVLVLHALTAVGLAVWRALRPTVPASSDVPAEPRTTHTGEQPHVS